MEEKLREKDITIKKLKFRINELEEKLKYKPSAIQIIALGLSCFALGMSIAKILVS